MVDPVASARLAHRALFLGLAILIFFVRLLPLSTMPVVFPGPDLLLCLTLVWVQRRPEYVPAVVVAAVFFIDDLLAVRAPGLWALLVLLGTEFLRSRETGFRDLPFLLEWAVTSLVIVVIAIANRLVLALFVVPQTGLGLTLMQVLATIAAYPVVVFVSHFAFGLRKAATGEVDALGHRL
ncbi:MAG: rod shape-determining protein MreD [Rhodobacteraceae bacterium]|nr:rod shape-determining protein MreD [Paracoccaceae bacterium]